MNVKCVCYIEFTKREYLLNIYIIDILRKINKHDIKRKYMSFKVYLAVYIICRNRNTYFAISLSARFKSILHRITSGVNV